MPKKSSSKAVESSIPEIPRSEYPRPDALRKDWMTLNGKWGFEFDPKHIGFQKKWFCDPKFSQTITVPFVFQSKLSGINKQDFIDMVWYARQFTIPKAFENKNVLLQFGAVDYECNVFLNGNLIGNHKGGCVPFFFDITPFLTANRSQDQLIVVQVYDPPFDNEIPRGKQTVNERMSGCDYEKSTGIWQSVWLEFVDEIYLDRSDYFIRVEQSTGKIDVNIQVSGNPSRPSAVEAQVFDGDTPLSEVGFNMHAPGLFGNRRGAEIIHLNVDPKKIELWTPLKPRLYTVHFNLIDSESDNETVLDTLVCSFGFRTIETKNGQLLLNGKPIKLIGALYQGYWIESLWTAPSDEAIQNDIELTFQMGFNWLRLHQKVEDPRFLYWCDRKGLMVWGEMSNAGAQTDRCKDNFIAEWTQVVRRDRNHPSIISWTPHNETWGFKMPDHADWIKSVYYWTKNLDPTRPVIDNDGWEHVLTDICTIHDYNMPEIYEKNYPIALPKDEKARTKFMLDFKPAAKIYIPGAIYRNEPVMITEWGGWGHWFDDPNVKADHFTHWGYGGILYKTMEEILKLYEAIIKLVVKREWIIGMCYTEWNDQYQEVNGFLTFDRRPKCDLAKIKQINEQFTK